MGHRRGSERFCNRRKNTGPLLACLLYPEHLRGLEEKGAIKVDAITKLGKSYGRLFRPMLSADDYATMQFERYYQNGKANCFSLMSSLLGNTHAEKEEVIDALHALLDEYEKK